MKVTLSPAKVATANAACAVGFTIIALVLSRLNVLRLDDDSRLYALLLLGPALSAAFCRRLSAVFFAAVGLATGVLLVGASAGLFVPSVYVDWGRVGIVVPAVSAIAFAVSVPVWWWIGRRRHDPTTGAWRSATAAKERLADHQSDTTQQ